MDQIYHVTTEENLADLGTRLDRVQFSDIGPESEWETGKKWMRGEVSDAIESGVLKPIRDLRGADERDTDEYKDGLVLGGEISDKWCNVVNMTRVQQIQKRVEFSNYLIVPTKFGF